MHPAPGQTFHPRTIGGRARGWDPRRLPPRVEVLGFVALIVAVGILSALGALGPTDPAAEAPAGASELGDTVAAGAPSTTTTTTPMAAPPPAQPATLTSSDGLLPVLHRVPTTDRVVFVTIDDGMARDPEALELLVAHGIPFTSFLTRDMAVEGQSFWRETQAADSGLEAHTIDHPNLTTVGSAEQQRQICGPLDTFEELFGDRPTLFRPPYGAYDDAVRSVAAGCGYRALVHWSGSANDGRIVMQATTFQPGDIILMHWRDDLAANLEALIALCESQDFRIGLLEDYLA